MPLVDLRPYLPGALGLAAAAFLWFVVRPLVGSASGWDSLSKLYQVDELPPGERFRSASATVEGGPVPVWFRNILTVVVGPSGFGLSIRSVFGKAPAIFIPWADVQSVAPSRALFVDTAVIMVRDQWPSISLSGRAGAAVLKTYGQSLSERVR
jgi:hypothetical protein